MSSLGEITDRRGLDKSFAQLMSFNPGTRSFDLAGVGLQGYDFSLPLDCDFISIFKRWVLKRT